MSDRLDVIVGDAANEPSLAVVRAIGFRQVGTQEDPIDGTELVFSVEAEMQETGTAASTAMMPSAATVIQSRSGLKSVNQRMGVNSGGSGSPVRICAGDGFSLRF